MSNAAATAATSKKPYLIGHQVLKNSHGSCSRFNGCFFLNEKQQLWNEGSTHLNLNRCIASENLHGHQQIQRYFRDFSFLQDLAEEKGSISFNELPAALPSCSCNQLGSHTMRKTIALLHGRLSYEAGLT